MAVMTAAATVHRRRTVARALSAMVEPPRFRTGHEVPPTGPAPLRTGHKGFDAGRSAGAVMLAKVHTQAKRRWNVPTLTMRSPGYETCHFE